MATTDCVSVCAYGGLKQLIAPNVELLGKLGEQRDKTATAWIYGMELPAMREIQRQLEARGVPTFLDSQTAVKALGVASRYAAIRRELSQNAG